MFKQNESHSNLAKSFHYTSSEIVYLLGQQHIQAN